MFEVGDRVWILPHDDWEQEPATVTKVELIKPSWANDSGDWMISVRRDSEPSNTSYGFWAEHLKKMYKSDPKLYPDELEEAILSWEYFLGK